MYERGEEDEVVLDAQSGEAVAAEDTDASAAALKDTLKTLRAELKHCREERDLNLAGWQRAKADLVNFRRSGEGEVARALLRGRRDITLAIVPTLDSFEQAMASPSWGTTDPTWRTGIERIKNQLERALEQEGIRSYGVAGESFDPSVHECMSVTQTTTEGEDHVVAQVLQRGYRLGEEVVRPAKVMVYQYREDK